MTEQPRSTVNVTLESRAGLPEELRFLVETYPRETWQAHRNLAGMAAFWLQRHASFREMGGRLTSIISDYREGGLSAPEFARAFAPRLNHFLGDLDGHHNVEDHHYFPVFAAAEKRLVRGFEILDADHHSIHEALERNAEAANAFIRALQSDADQQRFKADLYATENASLVAMLARHLDDEEDLIIPLILDRGDSLGV